MLNRAQIIGRLGDDPATKSFQGGGLIATLRLATTEKWTDKTTGEKKEDTQWHTITFSGKLAEICDEYLSKGDLIMAEGKIHHRKYTDKDGIEKTFTEIKGTSMKMLSTKGKEPSKTTTYSHKDDDFGQDIPF